MRKSKKYIPQKLRQYQKPKSKAVEMPKRTVLTKDKELEAYYRESLLLMAQTATYQAEMLLDCDVSVPERLVVQKAKNELDNIIQGILGQLSDGFQDLQYERSHFLNEMMKLCTLIPPKYYEKTQEWMVEKIQNLNGIK